MGSTDITDPPPSALAAWGAFDVDDPFPLFAQMRAAAPVHRVTLVDGHTAWLVLRYDEARAALNDPRLSKDMHAALQQGRHVVAEGLPGPALARHMLSMDPPDHTRLRRLVLRAFTPRRVEALRPRVQRLVDSLLDDMASAAGPVDFVARFAFPLPYTVICELLGVPARDRAALGEAFRALFLPADGAAPAPEAIAGAAFILDCLESLVAAREACPADDLTSALLAARDGGAVLSPVELLSTIFQLFVAGHDTTTSLIGNGLAALLTHPQQLAALKADLSLVPTAIEEFLRFDAPVPHSTFRYAVEPVGLGGVTIPAGEQVLICLAAANRDPDRRAHPDQLLIDREDRHHLAFGHGIHFCLGAPLARMEGEIAFTSLLSRFPDLQLAVPPGELRWGHGDGLVLRGLTRLPVLLGKEHQRG